MEIKYNGIKKKLVSLNTIIGDSGFLVKVEK